MNGLMDWWTVEWMHLWKKSLSGYGLESVILSTWTFVLPTYCTVLYLLYSLLHVSTLNLFSELRAFLTYTACLAEYVHQCQFIIKLQC